MIAMKYKNDYRELIRKEINNCITETALPNGKKYRGKVRDVYDFDDKLILITTDRQSAFDRILAAIPFKGKVLNLTSAWWFEQTKHIIKNHVIALPDVNVIIAKKCKVFPIEFVMRGYITGSTSTSLWTVYKNGSRNYCGIDLSEGLVKNQRLKTPLLTPTTKDKEHDKPISPEEIVSEGWMSQADWDAASNIALRLFAFGQQRALENGLILVDTKYELGRDDNGDIVLVDEIHTPDSSRYWIADTYENRFSKGKEPQNIDKEFLRLWFVDNCDPYNDKVLPPAPEELIVELSQRYIILYEMITGNKFKFPVKNLSAHKRLISNLKDYL
ncbi:MAG: phosphoribosylaminoimidazolesuccinocarboxamide synthase [Planctomycetia bacterium]|nr:phosphoribosylaminoimidazolesuccinocarboxamide synthase [Planctomycetia bacterium]